MGVRDVLEAGRECRYPGTRRGIGGIRGHLGFLGVLGILGPLGSIRGMSGGVEVSRMYWSWQGV